MQFGSKNLLQKYLFAIFSIVIVSTVFAKGAVSDKTLRAKTIENIANDDVSGEDLKIRKVAIEALGNRAGTVVVMSAQTGRIYSIVNQDWAIRRGFKPCSTIKLVTAVAGYNERLIHANGRLVNGSFRLGLDQSLSYSNNTFFQKVGKNLGSNKMIRYARKLGLGERTGINSPGEFRGKLPFGNENLRIYSHADDFEVTPLQLAVMVSALTNGGDLLIPRIVRRKYQKSNFKGFYRRELGLSPNVFERVIPGMVGAVRYGTAKSIRRPRLKIAGKTGSCIARKTWVGLFASVAPITNPRFAVVVITEGKYARGKHSAKIAGRIYQALIPRFNERFDGKLARKTIKTRPIDSKRPIKIVTGVAQIEKKPDHKNKPDSMKIRTGLGQIHKKRSTKKTNQKVKYRKKKETKKPNHLFPTIVIGGKSEITRPRVVKN